MSTVLTTPVTVKPTTGRPVRPGRARRYVALPAPSLMRATISSVAVSGVPFSLTTRLIAVAQTVALVSVGKW